jgi:hypothetical protein
VAEKAVEERRKEKTGTLEGSSSQAGKSCPLPQETEEQEALG